MKLRLAWKIIRSDRKVKRTTRDRAVMRVFRAIHTFWR